MVDSLVLEELTDYDKNLIDSCLIIFHEANDDTSRIYALDGIRIRMMHLDWVKYDDWVYKFVKKALKKKNNKATTNYLKKSIGDIYMNKSTILNSQGNQTKAIEYVIKALKIYEEINDGWRLSAGYLSLGLCYEETGDLKGALNYYDKGLALAVKGNHQDNIALAMSSIGDINFENGNLDVALKYYTNAYKKDIEFGDKFRISHSLSRIGHIYEFKGESEKALEYYYKALNINEEIGSTDGIAGNLYSIGIILFNINKISESQKIAKRSLMLSQETGYPFSIRNSSELMSAIYENQGMGMKALEMYKLHIKMSDSISNDEAQNAQIKLQSNYEYEKQKAIDDAEHDKIFAIEQEEKEKQQILTGATAGGLGLVVVFLIFVFNRLRATKKQKLLIEGQKEEVEQQKEVVELAHQELEEKNQEIMDSITYAKRIQSAILPSDKVVKEYLQESFIFYKPKDIVAGDFYWMEHKDNKVLFAAADCTGHGVPGAMVSVVCNNGLNRSVREHGLTDPGLILDKTREIIIQEFEKSDEDVKDGMDIALCSLEGKKLQYAGANNPLWIIRNGKILETKANKQPIGLFDNPLPYTTHSFDIESGDSIYIFSDGYVDQFGGEKGKKFKTKAFRELLLSIQEKSMEEQKLIIDESFETWKGNLEQIDDVCVIGVRV